MKAMNHVPCDSANQNYKVLFILPALNVCGGMESFIMNYYRNMDRTRFQFDFLTHNIDTNSYVNEIESLGGKVYEMPPFSAKSISEIRDKYIQLLKENKYDIVHCNMANAAFVYLKYAKKYSVEVRILHSHQNKAADTVSHAIRNTPLIAAGKKYSNCNIACSELAGDFLFKKKQYVVLPNAIDYEKYHYNESIRKEVRNELGIKDEFIIGHTGRFQYQKNHEFLIDVFNEYVKSNTNSKLLLVGQGENEEVIRQKVNKLNLQDKVIFTGARSDVERLLQAMDMFIFPSIYEGLGISVLEAQASGLYCLCSNGVPTEAKISDEFERLSLNADVSEWCKKIESSKTHITNRANIQLLNKYDIQQCSQALENLYMQEIMRNKKCV